MPDEHGIVKTVAWHEVCPWLCLLRVFRLSKEVSKLLLATAGVALTSVGWMLIGYLFSGSSDYYLQATRVGWYSRPPWVTPAESMSAGWVQAVIGWGNPFSVASSLNDEQLRWFAQDPFLGSWQRLSRPFWNLFESGFTFVGFAHVLLCAAWAAAVWAFFGGAITRIAAVELALDQRLSIRQAMRHAARKWRSYFGAPFFPLLGMAIPVALMILVGWLLSFNPSLLVLAIGWPVLLAAGLFMAIVALGLAFGWPLMWGAISTEGSDAFDALSRSYSYTYQRPLHYLFYAAIATLLGLLSWVLVAAVASAVAYLPLWGVSWSAGGVRTAEVAARLPADVQTFNWLPPATVSPDAVLIDADDRVLPAPEPRVLAPRDRSSLDSGSDASRAMGRYGVTLIAIWLGLVKLVALGFAYSYFWTASTAIYLLLRRTTDHTELDEVYLEEQEGAFGLPPLSADAAGVPIVDEQESPPLTDSQGIPLSTPGESKPAT